VLPATETTKNNGQPCTSNKLLWQALDISYNSATNKQINYSMLNETTTYAPIEWSSFSKVELRDAIAKCNNSSVQGPDHVT